MGPVVDGTSAYFLTSPKYTPSFAGAQRRVFQQQTDFGRPFGTDLATDRLTGTEERLDHEHHETTRETRKAGRPEQVLGGPDRKSCPANNRKSTAPEERAVDS
jgi:hypothetical protein